jgi:purine nucleoside phosphorylase
MVMLAILTDTPQSGEQYTTPYGLSAPIRRLEWGEDPALVCAMETADPRATVRALKERGATHLWLCESAGAISSLLEPGDWLVPDDFIDGTRGQYYTYFSERAGGYIQQAPPFDPASRAALIEALLLSPLSPQGEGSKPSGRVFRRGVYVCVSSTRLETPAEAAFWNRAGGHIVGGFLSPCLMLARELDMPVAALTTVVRMGGEPGGHVAFEKYEHLLRDALSILKNS